MCRKDFVARKYFLVRLIFHICIITPYYSCELLCFIDHVELLFQSSVGGYKLSRNVVIISPKPSTEPQFIVFSYLKMFLSRTVLPTSVLWSFAWFCIVSRRISTQIETNGNKGTILKVNAEKTWTLLWKYFFKTIQHQTTFKSSWLKMLIRFFN